MGTGYTRNDTANNIADGNVINASDLDGEFDAVQAAFNGTTGHSHDGTSGEGPLIAAGGIASNAVTTDKILNANVTLAKIADQAANTVLVRDANSSGVVSAKAVADTQILIGDGTGFTAAALSGDVTMANTGAVTIANNAVTTAKIAADAITGAKIADDTINSEHYAAGSIDAEHLASNSVTSAKLDTNIQVAGTLGVTGETTLTTHLNMGDGDIIKLGDSADLQIYHDGSNSYIDDTGTGNLSIRASTNLSLQSATNEYYAQGTADGAFTLYYDNAAKLATASGGVSVTGTASATTFSGDLNGTINTATTAATQTAGDNTTKVATTAFVTTAVANAEPFPAGTSMLFQQTNAPTGWTKQTTHDDKALRIVTGTVGTGGSSAFSTAFATPSVAGGAVSGDPGTNQSVTAGNLAVSISGNISNTTLTTNQIPAHVHSIYTATNSITGDVGFAYQSNNGNYRSGSTAGVVSSGGNGGSHNHGHNISGSMTGAPTLSGNVTAGNLAVGASTASINVNYVDFIIANKD